MAVASRITQRQGGRSPYLALSSLAQRLVGLLIGAAIVAAAGVAAGWLLPRGPITTVEALGTIGVALLVGVAVGAVSGSRWALLGAPVAAATGFELARLGSVGPTVDAIHLGSTYGVIAFVVGRGVTATLALPPLLLGVMLGVETAARLGRAGTRRLGILGWLGSGLTGLIVVGLVFTLTRPASTVPVLGADGEPLAGSIAELTRVPIGGHDQALMIRGQDVEAPVLLHLAGGPGGTDLGAMRADTGLEARFVVATWEQRGNRQELLRARPRGDPDPRADGRRCHRGQ